MSTSGNDADKRSSVGPVDGMTPVGGTVDGLAEGRGDTDGSGLADDDGDGTTGDVSVEGVGVSLIGEGCGCSAVCPPRCCTK
jgi:hypothetical protein